MKKSLVNFCVFHQMTTAGFRTTGSVINSNAQFMTSTLLVCTIPDSLLAGTGAAVSAVSLSVSNNGQAVSQSKLFIAYHPSCYSCDSAGQCTSLVSLYIHVSLIYKHAHVYVTVINICMEYYMYVEIICLLSVVEMYEPYMNVYLYTCRTSRKKLIVHCPVEKYMVIISEIFKGLY